MSRVAIVGFVLVSLVLWFSTSGRTAAQSQEKPAPADARFDRKYVAVNFKQAGSSTSQIFKNVRGTRLGNREFLVGEYAVEGGNAEPDWKGVEFWIPIESIEALMVFTDYEAARRVEEKVRRGAPDK